MRWTDHLSTIRRAMLSCRTRYAWIVSSCIDYQQFDFLWEPTPWQAHQIHCWPSGSCQFGDTFLVPTSQWNQQQAQLVRLEDFRDVNFEHLGLKRLPWQIIQYQELTLPEVLAQATCHTPYVLFTNQTGPCEFDDPWLWRETPIVSLSRDNGVTLVPRSAHSTVSCQMYDYPWLDKTSNSKPARPLDIVFISNGEPNAEENWDRLREVTGNLPNRVHRLNGVDGRVAAYQAAARLSDTEWFFAVFAKLFVSSQFDWSWQPDLWQQPKHYIFHARNDVTGLEYGHQAMIAYNKKMTLENTAPGLDFTLDQPHEVVPIFSGVANYAFSPWMAWRTAFREAIKLKHSLPDVENDYRLRQWLTVGRGNNGVFSVMGAQDAVEYYQSVDGNFEQLRKTYEWSWLATYAAIRRPQLFTQSNT